MNTPSDNKIIDAFPFLKKIPAEMTSNYFSIGYKKYLNNNMQIYWEGDSCHGIAFILSGEIRVYKTGETGREITLYEIGPGETCILNASCILSGTHYPANAVTISPCEVFMLPAGELKSMIAAHDEVRKYIFSIFSYRLTSVMTLLEEVVFRKMDERLRDYLIEKSENDILKTTHMAIANDLGTAREVVSRILKDFERNKEVKLGRNSIQLLSL